MVKIRMSRVGRKNRPFFRIIVVDSREKRDGQYLEKLGTYDPLIDEAMRKVKIEVERYKHWLAVGAQPSESLARLLTHAKALEAKTSEVTTAAPRKPRAKRKRPAKKAKKPAGKK